MKKTISFVCAVCSTLFLAAGATRAAEKFDHLSTVATPMLSGIVTELSPPPCVIPPEES